MARVCGNLDFCHGLLERLEILNEVHFFILGKIKTDTMAPGGIAGCTTETSPYYIVQAC